jgi:hypothetical protein
VHAAHLLVLDLERPEDIHLDVDPAARAARHLM